VRRRPKPLPDQHLSDQRLFDATSLLALTSMVLAPGTGLEDSIILMLRPDLRLTHPIPCALIFARSFAFVPPHC